MSPVRLEVHPRAVAEARAARRWYARRLPALATRFLAELDDAVTHITTAPQQGPAYLHGMRVYHLHRFPYLVVYRDLGTTVQVIAVAHTRRRPGYWRRRSP
jgi:plasmid stabilization system protein ParE